MAEPQEPQKVAVRSPDGKVGYVPAEQVASLPAGWTAASPEEVEFEEKLARAEGVGQQAIAATEAAARGVTLGLSDAALGAVLGDEYSEGAQLRQQANPLLAGLTEGTAGLAAIVASGGTGAAAKAAAYTPAGLAARLGAGARTAAQGVTGAGGLGLGARIAQRAVPLAAEGAVEGAIIGAGQAVSQASLGNADLTAERLLSGAAGGALLGAGAGSAFGFIGGAGSYGIARASELTAGGRRLIGAGLTRALGSVGDVSRLTIKEKAQELARESAVKAATGARGTDLRKLGSAEKIAQLGDDILNFKLKDGSTVLKAGDTVDDVLPRLKQARAETGERLGALRKEISEAQIPATRIAKQWLDDVDNGVLNPLKSSPSPTIRAQAKRIEKQVQWIREVSESATASRKLADDLLGQVDGGLVVPAMSFVKAETRDQVAKLRETLLTMRDKSASDLLTRKDLDSVIQDVVQPLTKSADRKIAAAAKQYRSELRALKSQFTEPVTYDDLIRQQEALKKVVYPKAPKGSGLPPPVQAWASDLQKAERSLEGHLETYAEQAIERIRPGTGGAYREARRLNESFIKAHDIAKKSDLQNLGNRSVSPSDYGIGAAGGILAGGPAGLAVGVASALTHKAIRERGRSVVAVLADRVAKANGDIDAALGGYFREAVVPARSLARSTRSIRRPVFAPGAGSRARRGTYPAVVTAYGVDAGERRAKVERRIQDVRDLASNPTLALEKIQERLRGIDSGADQMSRPELAKIKTQLVATSLRGLNAVASRLPNTTQRHSMQPELEPVTLSQSEIDRVARVMHAVDKPMSILDDLRNGFVDRESVEVVKEVYPGLFAQMQEAAIRQISKLNERGTPLSYPARVELGIVFDFPSTPTMDPGFMARHQERAAAIAEQVQSAAPPPSARQIPQISTGQTSAQRLESR